RRLATDEPHPGAPCVSQSDIPCFGSSLRCSWYHMRLAHDRFDRARVDRLELHDPHRLQQLRVLRLRTQLKKSFDEGIGVSRAQVLSDRADEAFGNRLRSRDDLGIV